MLDNKIGWPVLSAKHNLRGMTLVEIMIAVAILAILLAATAPDFSIWIQNSRIRSSAETIQSGLALAKTEAVHQNLTTQFVTCGGATWEVLAASSVFASGTVCAGVLSPGWASVRTSGQVQSNNITIQSSQSTIGFNGLGRQVSTVDYVGGGGVTPTPPAAVSIDVGTAAAGKACTCPATNPANCGYPVQINNSATGKLRCLRLQVSSGGLVRMCDPALPAGTPQGC